MSSGSKKVSETVAARAVYVIIDYWKTFFGEETEMNELEEETHYDCWYKGKNIKVTATTSYDAQKKAAVIFKVPGKNQSNIRVHVTGHSDSKNEAVRMGAKAPPIVMPLAKRPVARARSFSGKICPNAFAAQGKTPA